MTTQDMLWVTAGAAAVLAVVSGVAEWRRDRRRDLDRIGWMPWRGLQLMAFGAALLAAALALRI